MQYFGGKHRHAGWLREHVLPIVNGRRLVEPFCGGLSATVALQPQLAADISPSLISLYKAVRCGWQPPENLTEDQYCKLKERKDPDDPMTAFAGFGCSFGGKWFGGYARGTPGRNYTAAAARGLVKKVKLIANTDLQTGSYCSLLIRAGDVIYCDPPYNATSHGYDAPKWNSEAFWEWSQWCADVRGAIVLVSEFSAPEIATVVAEKVAWSGVDGHNSGTRNTVEKLYRIG